MPIYEYRCEECGHEFEIIQKISDDPLQVCPACGEPRLIKLISAAGFRLSGTGWYETDFKSGKKRNLAEKSADSSSSGKADKKASGSKSGKGSA